MEPNYPEIYERLNRTMGKLAEGIPETLKGFARMHEGAVAEGALSPKVKDLIALAIGITVRCDGCIAYHVREALDRGARRQEVLETVGVAVLMGGGPSVVYGSEALEALEQFTGSGG